MTDEEALILTLLDRPREPAARLVYADWLEDHGQDELAEYLRLQTNAPRAPHARSRVRELHERHRRDWVDLGGLTITWHSALTLLCRRLAETVAWCTQREYKVLRTAELLPQLGHNRSGIEPLWRCRGLEERTRLVHDVANRRAAGLADLGLCPEVPANNPAGGRLLLFEPAQARGDGTVGLYSSGFFDAYQAPAWDTWLFYFDDGADGRRRVHAQWEAEWILRRKMLPVAFASYLVAWVPPQLVQAVNWASKVSAHQSMAWAEHVDCDLTTRLRELGWLQPMDHGQTLVRREERVGQSITPGRGADPNPPGRGAVNLPW